MTDSWIARAVDGLVAWRDRNVAGPKVADAIKRDEQWDYDQADLQPWDNEPDEGRLIAAFGLRADDSKRAFTELYRLAEAGSPRAMNAIGEY